MAQNEKTSPIKKRANVEEIELVDGDWTSGTYVNGVWYPRKERKWICLTISDSEHSYDLDITSFFLWYLNMSQPSPALVRKLDAVKPKTIDMDGLITNRRTGALYYRNSETSKTWRGFEYELKKWTDKAYKSAEKASKRARSERAKLAKQTASSSPTQDDYGRPESATTIPSDEEWLRSTHGGSDSRMFESKNGESIIYSIATIITEDPDLFTDGDHLKQTTIDNINRLCAMAGELGPAHRRAAKLYFKDHPLEADILIHRVNDLEDLKEYIKYWVRQGLLPDLDLDDEHDLFADNFWDASLDGYDHNI